MLVDNRDPGQSLNHFVKQLTGAATKNLVGIHFSESSGPSLNRFCQRRITSASEGRIAIAGEGGYTTR